ncbi:hypothetical protein PAXINDRAFT_104215 [Paxillus involutus ATCC 200175]|uniref:Uncharacterized protein n=1 Tax=Paxillus involutus ATCC 200175 TaxID=664439 RepID=A0A0C9SS84_PAXIN|nr:hypothetical protein PAXINDRAFT_104215 [Paxillus involutus ATCC 200175]
MVISLWEISELSSSTVVPSYPCARVSLPSWGLLAHSLSTDRSTLYIAVTQLQRARIYTISLDSNLPNANEYRLSFNLIADFDMRMRDAIKCIDPESSLVLLYCTARSVDIMNWHTNARSTVTINDSGKRWNGVTALRFCGPYFLCFRINSLEAYPLPAGFSVSGSSRPDSLPILLHRFPNMTYRRVSLSDVRSRHHPSGEIYTVFFLVNDVFRGVLHYQVDVKISPVPSISVKLLALQRVLNQPPFFYTGVRPPFVSTWALGSVGLRGVWVSRQANDIDRKVIAFTTHPSKLRSTAQLSWDGTSKQQPAEPVPDINGKIILAITSYDLREDATIFAISESTGRIALGSRAGNISLI